MLAAAQYAVEHRKLSLAEELEPYRDYIQQCLTSGVSVGKIQVLMQGEGVGKGRSAAAWQKHVRLGGYIQARGKYKGLTREQVIAKSIATRSGVTAGLDVVSPLADLDRIGAVPVAPVPAAEVSVAATKIRQ